MDIREAILLLKHLRFSQSQFHQLPLHWNFEEFQSPSYVLGYFGDTIANAIHAAGGMAGEW